MAFLKVGTSSKPSMKTKSAAAARLNAPAPQVKHPQQQQQNKTTVEKMQALAKAMEVASGKIPSSLASVQPAPSTQHAAAAIEENQRALADRMKRAEEYNERLRMEEKEKQMQREREGQKLEEQKRRELAEKKKREQREEIELQEREQKRLRMEKMELAKREREMALSAQHEENLRARAILEAQERERLREKQQQQQQRTTTKPAHNMHPSSSLVKNNSYQQQRSQHQKQHVVETTADRAVTEKSKRLLENARNALAGGAAASNITPSRRHQQQMMTPSKIKSFNVTPRGTPSSLANNTNYHDRSIPRSHSKFPSSYEMSPMRDDSDDSDSEDQRRGKPIPPWAHKESLIPMLKAQARMDPDMIFPNPPATCSLSQVFGKPASNEARRGSSGNWQHDRLRIDEELNYKRTMGYRII